MKPFLLLNIGWPGFMLALSITGAHRGWQFQFTRNGIIAVPFVFFVWNTKGVL